MTPPLRTHGQAIRQRLVYPHSPFGLAERLCGHRGGADIRLRERERARARERVTFVCPRRRASSYTPRRTRPKRWRPSCRGSCSQRIRGWGPWCVPWGCHPMRHRRGHHLRTFKSQYKVPVYVVEYAHIYSNAHSGSCVASAESLVFFLFIFFLLSRTRLDSDSPECDFSEFIGTGILGRVAAAGL